MKLELKQEWLEDKERHAVRISAAFRTVLNIAKKWRLSDDELAILLGGISRSTLRRWKAQVLGPEPRIIRTIRTTDLTYRLSYLLGIYQALQILFNGSENADVWLSRRNTAEGFDGGRALDRMLRGGMTDLQFVRQFLDGWLW